MKRYFLFDTETGGFDPNSVSLLSFFGLVLDQALNIVGDIQLDIKPDDGRYHLDAAALKVNRINILEHHELAITETEAAKKLREFLFRNSYASSAEKLVPMGHNIGQLDIPMGKRLIGSDEWARWFSYRTLDTACVAQFMALQGKLEATNDCSLKQLSEHYKIDYTGAHNAKRDVFITLEVLKAMLKEGAITTCPTPPTAT